MKPHIAFFLPTLEGGGAERAFVHLANRFIAMDVQVDFVVADSTGPYLDELASDVRLIHFQTRRKIATLFRLTDYLRVERPQALLTALDMANAGAVAANALAGSPSRCVISQRSLMRPVLQMERPVLWRAWLHLFGIAYRRAAFVICNSNAAYLEMTRALGVKEELCTVVYNAIDIERIAALARVQAADPWLEDSAPPLVIAVGSLTPIKDLATLVRAFGIVQASRDCNLLILGEGPERNRLQALVSELGIERRVRMPGFAPNPFSWMSHAQVLVSSSLIEGCPNVIQQALACGTAIVATNCPGGTSEILENGRWGRLVPVGDFQSMASAIVDALDDPHPIDGRMRATDFDSLRTAERYLDLLLSENRREAARPAALRATPTPCIPRGRNDA
jgi:glycosyltransferase involved in cell wall biosynthesis